MRLTVNGKTVDLEKSMTISEYLQSRGTPDALVAVEHNQRWLKREEWHGVVLNEGDELEIVRMMAGG